MRPKVTDRKELDSVVNVALARTRRRTTPQVAAGPEAEEAAPAKAVVETPCEPVGFVCNAVPALGLGLGAKLYYFQHGFLELSTAEAVAAIRAHALFGRQIFEAVAWPDEIPDSLQEKLGEVEPESQSTLLKPGERRRGPQTIKLHAPSNVLARSGEPGRTPVHEEKPPRIGHGQRRRENPAPGEGTVLREPPDRGTAKKILERSREW